jgi:hypothetical protein
MQWRKIGLYALVVVSVLVVLFLAGWGLSRWSGEQVQVEEPQALSPVATVTPTSTATPGWWGSPLPVPTQPEK